MKTYMDVETLQKLSSPEITGYLTSIHEFRGKQALFLNAKPDVLKALWKVARIQSTEASNRIEGIWTSSLRLKKLMEEKTTPINRNELEIAGYRDVLNTIHESYEFIPLTPNVLLQLHRDLFSRQVNGAGGHWKSSDNIIAQTNENGQSSVRFRPVSCAETPLAMEALCSAFKIARDQGPYDPLLLTMLFVLDFLCIHPFHDGNGRMSRLLTLLLLYQSGYWVGKYISLEKMIEQSKETYYEVLQASSTAWHEGTHDPIPFVRYMLGVILKAYREFESRVTSVTLAHTPKAERIRNVFDTTLGKVSKREILERCPDISVAMVEKTLKELLDEGFIQKSGVGKGTVYFR